jgi:hypothetical protein
MVDRSKMIADTVLAGQKYGVFYYPTTEPVYGADAIQRLSASFESLPIDGGSSLLSWKELSWDSSLSGSARLYVYVRSSSSTSGLPSASWSGPYLNGTTDLAGFAGRYMQISMVLYADMESGVIEAPIVSRMSVSSHVSSGAKLFFTKSFSLGFKPKHILLTYNGTVPVGSLVQFAISGSDTSENEGYQLISPNKIEQLSDLYYLSDSIKVMMMATGSTEIPFSIDEFSLALSGDAQKVIT